MAPQYEELKALFPMAVTDGRVDIEKLRALMGDVAVGGPERYGLSWAGKSDALKTLRQQTTATLLPAPSESENTHAIVPMWCSSSPSARRSPDCRKKGSPADLGVNHR